MILMTDNLVYDDITLLITHYNRSSSLARELEAFRNLHMEFNAIVVSDDGSNPEHLNAVKALQEEYGFQLVTALVNKGLGNNINKGQDAVATPYTLYVQEDFVPLEDFRQALLDARRLMQKAPDIDMARFYAYELYPSLEPVKDGFSLMKFDIFSPGYYKFFMYSDHPHLRRSDFLKKFGRYVEGKNPEATEYRMMMSFLKRRGQAVFYDDYQSLFVQINTEDEPSTMKRNILRNSTNPVVAGIRHLYRYVKFNVDYLTTSTPSLSGRS